MPALKASTVLRGLGSRKTMGGKEKLDLDDHFAMGEKLAPGDELEAVEKLGHYLINRTIDDGGDGGINDVMRGVMYSYAHAILEQRFGSPLTGKSEASTTSFKDLSLGSSLSSVDHHDSNLENSRVGPEVVAAEVISTSAIGIDSTAFAPLDVVESNGGITPSITSHPISINGDNGTASFSGEMADGDQVSKILGHQLYNVHHSCHDISCRAGEQPDARSEWSRGLRTRWWKPKQSPRRFKRKVFNCVCPCIRGSDGFSGEQGQSRDTAFQLAIIKRASTLMPGSDGRYHL